MQNGTFTIVFFTRDVNSAGDGRDGSARANGEKNYKSMGPCLQSKTIKQHDTVRRWIANSNGDFEKKNKLIKPDSRL